MQLTIHKDLKVQSWAAHTASLLPEIPLCESWQQAVQYIDERPVVQVAQTCPGTACIQQHAVLSKHSNSKPKRRSSHAPLRGCSAVCAHRAARCSCGCGKPLGTCALTQSQQRGGRGMRMCPAGTLTWSRCCCAQASICSSSCLFRSWSRCPPGNAQLPPMSA